MLIVAHGTLIRLLVCAFLGLNADDYRRRLPTVGTASLTTLIRGPAGTGLLSYNLPAIHPRDPLPALACVV